jgi:hypothetical protein
MFIIGRIWASRPPRFARAAVALFAPAPFFLTARVALWCDPRGRRTAVRLYEKKTARPLPSLSLRCGCVKRIL